MHFFDQIPGLTGILRKKVKNNAVCFYFMFIPDFRMLILTA